MVGLNQRYDIIGERLADRQKEMEATLEKVKVYLQDVQEILTWLEEKESSSTPAEAALPTQEDEAKRERNEHQVGRKSSRMRSNCTPPEIN